jgi:hypothetical protein
MAREFLISVTHFKADPDKVLNELQRMLNYNLDNMQHQKAKVLGVQAAAGGTISLRMLHSVWSSDAILRDFASVLNYKILGTQ